MSESTTQLIPNVIALTGLSSAIKPEAQADLWIVYLPKGDRAVDQSAEDGTPTKLRVNPSALSAKRMEAARRLAAAKPNANQPYTDYNHDDKEASGRPLKFAWHDDLGVIGLTRRTLQAIERTTGDPPEFQAFSPHVPLDPETGEAVGIYMNCGGFVNRPLFGDATSLSAAAHLPQELVAADPNEVELISTDVVAASVPDASTPATGERAGRPFYELIAKLCAHFQLDASTVTEPELIAAFEESVSSQPAELTAKAALHKPSDEEIGMELVGFAVGCGILAPAESAEWERRLAKDRAGWTKELLAKAPSVLLGRVIQDQSAGEAAGGTKPKAKWEQRVEELCAKDPLIAPIAAKDPVRAKSIALERIAREEPALLK
ncbi:MAG TPA: hypothetical protein VNL17_08610 [Verrucomicrobiae bacterium]|nr:hypothetical protein [Verrucomicrobiae bacterium]